MKQILAASVAAIVWPALAVAQSYEAGLWLVGGLVWAVGIVLAAVAFVLILRKWH